MQIYEGYVIDAYERETERWRAGPRGGGNCNAKISSSTAEFLAGRISVKT